MNYEVQHHALSMTGQSSDKTHERELKCLLLFSRQRIYFK